MNLLVLDMEALSAYGVPVIVASLWVLYEYLKAVPVLKRHPWVISWILLACCIVIYTMKHGVSIDAFSYSLLTCGLIVMGNEAVSKLLFRQFGIEHMGKPIPKRRGGSTAKPRAKPRAKTSAPADEKPKLE